MVHGVRALIILACIFNFFASLGYTFVVCKKGGSKNSNNNNASYKVNNIASGLSTISGVLTIIAATWWGFNASGSGGTSGLKSLNSLHSFSNQNFGFGGSMGTPSTVGVC